MDGASTLAALMRSAHASAASSHPEAIKISV
jgi:hypothetical protein